MRIHRINDTTIRCIITEDDLKENGLKIDDLFERKEAAVRFIRGIIREAVVSEHLNLESEYTSMKISVLPDRSVSLTITEDPSASAMIREVREKAALAAKPEKEGEEERPSEFLFVFSSMEDLIRCAKSLCLPEQVGSSLYRGADGSFYLILSRTAHTGLEFETRVLSVNEFADLLASDSGQIAFIREHSICIQKEAAIQMLEQL